MILARSDLRSIKLELDFAGYKSTKTRMCSDITSYAAQLITVTTDYHAARAYAYRNVQELREGGYHPSGATVAVGD